MLHPASLFSQLLNLVSRVKFNSHVRDFGSDRYSKGFTSWAQFVSMLFCQLAQAKSLREICYGLESCTGKLNHLGIGKAPNKSTLSYANANRPWQLYERIFYDLLADCHLASPGKKRKFRFKNDLLSLDASVIDLCLEMYPWAEFQQTKGAVKLHMLLDHDGYLPVYACITSGKVHEVNVARTLTFPKGSIIAMDRGYTDYALYQDWTEDGVFFVTKMKKNAVYTVVGEFDPPQQGNILSDETIMLDGPNSKCSVPLRRVVVLDEKSGEEVVLLTNHHKFGATTISNIYKDRWEIETFFRTIKQNLKIKTFVGTTENALRIQIWTALVAILLIKYLNFKSTWGWSMSNLVALLHWNLFTYRKLWQWVNNPFEVPPEKPPDQPELPFLDSILLT